LIHDRHRNNFQVVLTFSIDKLEGYMSQVSSPEVTQIAQSYLQMPYNQFVWLRKEFMCLCGDALEAMIMRVVEYEIEGDRRAWLRHATELIEQGKPAPEEPEWWISLSHKQIQVRLYDAIKNEKTLRGKLKSLIEDKHFLLMRDNPNNRYGSPQYTINKELIQKKLNDLPPLPGIKEAAQSQSNPLPETAPPTNIGTSSQSRQEGGTRNGTSPLPNLVPAPRQNREVPPPKTGTPYKKDKNSSENFNKNIEEENDTPTSSHPDASSSLSSSSNLNSMSPLESSGHHIATDISTNVDRSVTNSEFETQHSDAREVQGYKTDDSSAVKKSITADVQRAIKSRRTAKEAPKKRDLLAEATPEVQAVVHEWVNIFKKPTAINKTLIENAKELASYQPDPGEIKACYAWLWTTDRDWYAKHGGVTLGVVAKKFPGFRSLGDIPTPSDKTKKRSIDRSGFSQQSLDKEFYPTKEPTNEQKEKIYAF
jgi:hypothetical protein